MKPETLILAAVGLIVALLVIAAVMPLLGMAFLGMTTRWGNGMMGGMMGPGMMGGWTPGGLGVGWIWNLFVALFLVGFLVVIVVGVYYLVTGHLGATLSKVTEPTAVQILKQRYARGEITKEQYLEMKRHLEH